MRSNIKANDLPGRSLLQTIGVAGLLWLSGSFRVAGNPTDGSSNPVLEVESASIVAPLVPGESTVELVFDHDVTLPEHHGLHGFGMRKCPINTTTWTNVVMEDLDADGRKDLVVADSLTVLVYLNTSSTGELLFASQGIPIAMRTISNPGSQNLHTAHYDTAIAFGDVDNDGDRDLLCGEKWFGSVVYFPADNQTYPGQIRQFGQQKSLQVISDGIKVDIANAVEDYTTVSPPPGYTIGPPLYRHDWAMASPAMIKYDDNNSNDLFVADNLYDLQSNVIFWIYLYEGIDLQTGSPYYSGPVPFKINGQQAVIPQSVESAVPTFVDVDGINGPDLVVSTDDGRVWTALNAGTRSSEGYQNFQALQELKINSVPVDFGYSASAVPTDIDGDGDLDMVVSTRETTGQPRRLIKVHKSSAAGSLATLDLTGAIVGGGGVSPYTGGEHVYTNLRLADFNHDGNLDLIQQTPTTYEIAVAFSTDTGNNYAPVFASPVLCKNSSGGVFRLQDYGLALQPSRLSIFDPDLDMDPEGIVLAYGKKIYFCAKDCIDLEGCLRLAPPVEIALPAEITASGNFSLISVDFGDFTPGNSTNAIDGAIFFKEGGFGTNGTRGREAYWAPVVPGSLPQFGSATLAAPNSNDLFGSYMPSIPNLIDVDGDGDLDAVTAPESSYVWWKNNSGPGPVTSLTRQAGGVQDSDGNTIYKHWAEGFCAMKSLDPEDPRPLVISPAYVLNESPTLRKTRLYQLNGPDSNGKLLIENHAEGFVRVDQTLASSLQQVSPSRLKLSFPLDLVEGDTLAINRILVDGTLVSIANVTIQSDDADGDGVSDKYEVAYANWLQSTFGIQVPTTAAQFDVNVDYADTGRTAAQDRAKSPTPPAPLVAGTWRSEIRRAAVQHSGPSTTYGSGLPRGIYYKKASVTSTFGPVTTNKTVNGLPITSSRSSVHKKAIEWDEPTASEQEIYNDIPSHLFTFKWEPTITISGEWNHSDEYHLSASASPTSTRKIERSGSYEMENPTSPATTVETTKYTAKSGSVSSSTRDVDALEFTRLLDVHTVYTDEFEDWTDDDWWELTSYSDPGITEYTQDYGADLVDEFKVENAISWRELSNKALVEAKAKTFLDPDLQTLYISGGILPSGNNYGPDATFERAVWTFKAGSESMILRVTRSSYRYPGDVVWVAGSNELDWHEEVDLITIPAGQTYTLRRDTTPYQGFDGAMVTVSIVPMTMTWEAISGWDNVDENKSPVDFWYKPMSAPPDGRWLPGRGNRIFADKKTQSDYLRNRLVLKIDAMRNMTSSNKIYLRAFDVDDPTPTSFDSGGVVDSGPGGGDNKDAEPGRVSTGQFIINGQPAGSQVEVTLDEFGDASVIFETTAQPGDNFRVAAAWNASDLADMQTSSPGAAGYVPPESDKQAVNFSRGRVSPLLTVWRKVIIENDTMPAPPSPKDPPDRYEGVVEQWREVPGSSGGLSYVTFGNANNMSTEPDFYENGTFQVGGASYHITSSTSYSITLNSCPSLAYRESMEGEDAIVLDDDDFRTPAECQLPNTSLFKDHLVARYVPAYILMVDGNKLGLNPNQTVPFSINEQYLLGSVMDDAKDLTCTDGFWNMLVVSAYQGAKENDLDGDGVARVGLTQGPLLSDEGQFVAIYLEVMRDTYHANLASSTANTEKRILEDLRKVIAHEIGHGPTKGADSDHNEEGLMGGGGSGPDYFTPASIQRFRNAKKWLRH